MGAVHFLDSVRGAILKAAGINRPSLIGERGLVLSPQLAMAAYLGSGMLRKVISIPAHDRVREWRDWQADKDQIEAIEKEERRLGLQAKVKQAEVLRGIGGGAIVLAAPGDPALPINASQITSGKLAAANVVSRWQLTLIDMVTELIDPAYGTPKWFSVNSGNGSQTRIHPSRVVAFRGDPLPEGAGLSPDDAFWGASKLEMVLREVTNSDEAQAAFLALIRKAKLTRIGIPNLSDSASTTDGKTRLEARIETMVLGESVMNATIYQSGDDADAETITDYQISWTGMPEMLDAFDQRVAAVSDIPFTRLMGRSPSGLNATGKSDQDNWDKMVAAGQNLETRQCLDQIDVALLPSAAVPAEKVTWRFAPLNKPSEKEEADTFFTTMQAVEKLQATGAIPDEAFAKGLQNLMSEREWVPGLDQALAEIPEDERFGLNPEVDQADPSAIQADPTATGGRGSPAPPRRRAANDARFNDATPRTLYVCRNVINVADLRAWAKQQGLPDLQDDLHVTVVYSRTPVDWMTIEGEWNADDKGQVTIPPGGVRIVEPLGGRTAALLFTSSALSWRHESIIRSGATSDYDQYQPHISLTAEPCDLAGIEPYRGKIVLGPEIFEEVDDG